jgi:hypothetical protein
MRLGNCAYFELWSHWSILWHPNGDACAAKRRNGGRLHPDDFLKKYEWLQRTDGQGQGTSAIVCYNWKQAASWLLYRPCFFFFRNWRSLVVLYVLVKPTDV